MNSISSNTLSFKINDRLYDLKGIKSNDTNASGRYRDSAEISNTAKVLNKLDNFMNLGSSNRLDLDGLNETEKEEFLKMMADLIQNGIIGYEVLEIDGKPEKHDILMQIVDPRTRGAKLYKKNDF